MALELFRALVPVVNGAVKQSPKESMRFSNDCLYVGQELTRIVGGLRGPPREAGTRDKLEDGLEKVKLLAESWFEDAIVSGVNN